MIVEVRAGNVYVFREPVAISMQADMRARRFSSNVHQTGNFNITKTVGIFGANNAGKTCLIKCIHAIRNVLLNQQASFLPNFFSKSNIVELGITFMEGDHCYTYDFRIDADKREYLYERFAQIEKDRHGNEKELVWLMIDRENRTCTCLDESLVEMVFAVSKGNLIMHLVDTTQFPELARMKKIATDFAGRIDIINMNNIPNKKTVKMLKSGNVMTERVVSFIKKADLDLDDYEYASDENMVVDLGDRPDEKVLDIPEDLVEQLHLTSTYRGVRVPSIVFDSTGTKKVVALASYVVEGLESGRILVIDELDSSFHFRLTRAIVAMFNNELNTDAQMIFTAHDISLMDVKRLFRKEQIWFVHKDSDGVYAYSLADFTSRDGVRDTTDVIEKYRNGVLGALPEPDMIELLIDVNSHKRRETAG